MQYLAEIHPKANLQKISKELEVLGSFDGYDIPDSPMGIPSILPISLALIIRQRSDSKRIIINQRLLDVNELFVNSLSLTAKAFNLEIAFTKGDKPKVGKEVGYLSSQEAVNIAKRYDVRSGMMVSLRKSREEIIARLESNADFLLGLHFSLKNLDNLDISRIIPYVIIKTEKNKELLSQLNQPTFSESELPQLITDLRERGISTILLSSPKDLDFFTRFSKSF
ncbi:hypothetical protein [Acidianus sp. RZ1]|uniref:hypothetical protein n=1 Tax=Acidianus sp. RZ1 TaxID=1540082 RepID=UPI0014923D29|nr:hypothetical protein [Acidianus sp. RZ1]NON61530.1 hypothetical protein [Acidianus sp. RZ1]